MNWLSWRRWALGVGFGLLWGALSACGWWEMTLPQALPSPWGSTPTPVVTALPPVVPPTGTLGTGSEPQATLPAQGCVPLAPQSPPQEWTYRQALTPPGVLAVLNGGMSPEELNAALQDAGVGAFPRAVYEADLNGDGREDVLVVLVNPQSTSQPPEGVLVVGLSTPQGGYCEAGRFPSTPPEDGLVAPVVYLVRDLDGDGRAEVVLGLAGCVAPYDCRERVLFLGWREAAPTAAGSAGALQPLLEGPPPVVNTPEVEVLGPDEQGRYQVAVSSEGVPGGTGPARGFTLVYAPDPQTHRWALVTTRWAPSPVRIHVLHDADRAARAGDEMQALLLYGRVVADRELRDEALPGAGPPERLHALLAAYARFRTLVLHAQAGRTAMMEATYTELQQAVDADPALVPYGEMAARFREVYHAQGFAAACRAAREYAAEHPDQVLAPLGPQVYGTNNRAYAPEDVCMSP